MSERRPSRWAPWRRPGVDWRAEGYVAGLTAVFSALAGSVVGLVWRATAPKVAILAAVNGSDAAPKALLDDDVRLAALGVVAGVLCVALVLAVARRRGRGPGASLGLAVGGVLGSLVAARLGEHLERPGFVSSLHVLFPGIDPAGVSELVSFFGFGVRAEAAVLAWPIAAVLVHLLACLLPTRSGRPASELDPHPASTHRPAPEPR